MLVSEVRAVGCFNLARKTMPYLGVHFLTLNDGGTGPSCVRTAAWASHGTGACSRREAGPDCSTSLLLSLQQAAESRLQERRREGKGGESRSRDK